MGKRKHSIKVPVNFAGTTYSTTAPHFREDIGSRAPGTFITGLIGTTQSIGTQSIFIPENSAVTVTFSSVNLFLGIQDVTNGNGILGTFSSTVTMNGVSSPVFLAQGTNNLTNTGENWSGIIGPIDYTGFFNSNWGPSTTTNVVSVGVLAHITGTTAVGYTARGVFGNFEITYVYDDTATRRANTVCIPYESPTGSIPISLAAAVNPVFAVTPQLTGANGWLNSYANLSIRHRWMEVKGNVNNQNTATVHGLQWTFDQPTGSSSASLPARWSAGGSDTWQMYQIDMLTYSTTATHSFHLWGTLINRWYNTIANEWITYEYDVAGTTASLNYVELPVNYDSPIVGITQGTISLQLVPNRFVRDLNIQEPGPIILRKASVELNYTATGSVVTAIRGTGSTFGQRFINYIQASNIAGIAGQFSFQHGLDNTSRGGTGISISRGSNSIILDIYQAATASIVGSMYSTNGVIKLLYESGIASSGIDSHNHTLYGFTRNMSFTASAEDRIVDNFSIPETTHYLNTAALRLNYWATTSANSTSNILNQSQVLPFEADGAGYRSLYQDAISGNAELTYGSLYTRIRSEYEVYPNYPDTNVLSLTQSRVFRTTFTTPTRYGYGFLVVYHTITSAVSGTISGSSGANIYLELYDMVSSVNAVIYATASRVGNGTFSFTTYDDTNNYRVVAYEGVTRKGASKTALPGTGFDINLLSNQTSGFGSG